MCSFLQIYKFKIRGREIQKSFFFSIEKVLIIFQEFFFGCFISSLACSVVSALPQPNLIIVYVRNGFLLFPIFKEVESVQLKNFCTSFFV